jgi:hypothetical protein
MKNIFMVLPLALSFSVFAQNSASLEKKCDDIINKAKKQADNCLKIKDAPKRKACFDKIGQTVEQMMGKAKELEEVCKPKFDAAGQEYKAKEASLYPNQPSSFGDGGQQGQSSQGQSGQQGQGPQGQPGQQGSGSQGQPGQQGQGTQGQAPFDCRKLISDLEKEAAKCMGVATFEKRKACFDQIGQKFKIEEIEGKGLCRGELESLKNKVSSQEKSKYPNQPSALGGSNSQGPQGTQGTGPQGQPGKSADDKGQKPEGGKAADCSKILEKIKKAADACLKLKARDKRQACMDKVGEQVEGSSFPAECREAVAPLKQQVMEKEKQLYPNQEPTVK